MSPEERDRLAKVEAEVELLKEQLGQANEKLDRLLTLAAMGQGAWLVILRLGAIVTALAATGAGAVMAWHNLRG